MQRQNSAWVLMIQLLLPLLVLTALNPRVRAETADWSENGSLLDPIVYQQNLRQTAQMEPWHAPLWDLILKQDTAAGDWPQAAADGEKALAWQALSDEGRLMLGDAYEQLGRKQHAISAWQGISSLKPDVKYEKIYRLQRKTKDLPAAFATLQEWTVAVPENAGVVYQMGLLQTVLDSQQAVYTLDQAWFLDGAYAKPVKALKQALAVSATTQTESYHRVVVGRALGSLGEWDLAQAVFQQAVNQKADYAEAWAFLGEASRQLGEDDYPALSQAMRLNSNSVLVQSLMGMYWMRSGRPEKAFVNFNQASILEPDQAVWQIQMGEALARMGKPAYAMIHYQEALRLNSAQPEYWRLMVQFCLNYNIEIRRIGLPAARRLVLMDPEQPEAYDLHGRVLLELGDMDNALAAFERGLTQKPDDARLVKDVGMIYLETQRPDLAFVQLSRAAELARQQNNSEVLAQVLELLKRIN